MEMMLSSKKFDVDSSDHIIIDGVQCAGTPDFYQLIFKKVPDYDMYTEDDKRKYKSILLATNAHRHMYTEHIDTCTPSTVIYGVTEDTNIDM